MGTGGRYPFANPTVVCYERFVYDKYWSYFFNISPAINAVECESIVRQEAWLLLAVQTGCDSDMNGFFIFAVYGPNRCKRIQIVK